MAGSGKKTLVGCLAALGIVALIGCAIGIAVLAFGFKFGKKMVESGQEMAKSMQQSQALDAKYPFPMPSTDEEWAAGFSNFVETVNDTEAAMKTSGYDDSMTAATAKLSNPKGVGEGFSAGMGVLDAMKLPDFFFGVLEDHRMSPSEFTHYFSATLNTSAINRNSEPFATFMASYDAKLAAMEGRSKILNQSASQLRAKGGAEPGPVRLKAIGDAIESGDLTPEAMARMTWLAPGLNAASNGQFQGNQGFTLPTPVAAQ